LSARIRPGLGPDGHRPQARTPRPLPHRPSARRHRPVHPARPPRQPDHPDLTADRPGSGRATRTAEDKLRTIIWTAMVVRRNQLIRIPRGTGRTLVNHDGLRITEAGWHMTGEPGSGKAAGPTRARARSRSASGSTAGWRSTVTRAWGGARRSAWSATTSAPARSTSSGSSARLAAFSTGFRPRTTPTAARAGSRACPSTSRRSWTS